MTPHRDRFCEYEEYDWGEVLLGDDIPCIIAGCGRMKIKFHDGRMITLPSVAYIPHLARNLIFVSKMADANVDFSLNKIGCKLVHGSMMLVQGVQDGTMYRLLGSIAMPQCNSASIFETI